MHVVQTGFNSPSKVVLLHKDDSDSCTVHADNVRAFNRNTSCASPFKNSGQHANYCNCISSFLQTLRQVGIIVFDNSQNATDAVDIVYLINCLENFSNDSH